jgi:O-methyltransferase
VRFFRRIYDEGRYLRQYLKFKEFTMISAEEHAATLGLAERSKGISGCVVECGLWHGGTAASLVSVRGAGRKYFSFDSFDGLPPANEIGGPEAMRWQSQGSPDYLDNRAAPAEFANRAMKLSGATRCHLIKGWFYTSMRNFDGNDPIAFLHLDADWCDSTMVCLERFFDQVNEGGLIVLDDYYTRDGGSRALHDFLSSRSAPERIESRGPLCFVEKRKASMADLRTAGRRIGCSSW